MEVLKGYVISAWMRLNHALHRRLVAYRTWAVPFPCELVPSYDSDFAPILVPCREQCAIPYNCLLFTRGRLDISIALIGRMMEAAMQWITQRWRWLEGKPHHKMAILLLIALIVVGGFATHLALHQQHELLTNEEVGLRQ
jgi:hypothetical protein